MTKSIVIGIDPGVTTGIAEWDRTEQRFVTVGSAGILEAMDSVAQAHKAGTLHAVVFEDARLRTWFGTSDARQERSGAGIREGVGSVKRDCQIWADFLGRLGVPFKSVKPSKGGTKWPAEKFALLTGWTGRTNEHGRDAAVLALLYGGRL